MTWKTIPSLCLLIVVFHHCSSDEAPGTPEPEQDVQPTPDVEEVSAQPEDTKEHTEDAPAPPDAEESVGDGADSGNDVDGSVCEEAFNRQKTCAQGLDCDALDDPSRKQNCTSAKMGTTMSYQDAIELCAQLKSESECQCDGENKAEAETILTCTLDTQVSCKCL